MNDGDSGRFGELSRGVEARTSEDDVVGLPLTGWEAGVGQWWVLAIDGACLAIGIGVGFVAVEDLDFEVVHEKDSGIAAILTDADRWIW